MHSDVLLFGKVFFVLVQVADGACHLITGITDGFQFSYLAEHHSCLLLRFVRKMSVANLFQIIGYFHLHIVGYRLVALDTGKLALEFLFVLLVKKRTCHSKHAVHALSVVNYLFLSLQYANFRGFHDTAADEMQGSGLVGLSLVFGQQLAHDALHLGNETDE